MTMKSINYHEFGGGGGNELRNRAVGRKKEKTNGLLGPVIQLEVGKIWDGMGY